MRKFQGMEKKMTLDDNSEALRDALCSSVEPDTLVKWYCTERLVKSFRNLPSSVSKQVADNLANISSEFRLRNIRISDIDFASRSCGYTVDGVFYVVEW